MSKKDIKKSDKRLKSSFTKEMMMGEEILSSPEYYFNRELSWLDFNHRVLDEAFDSNNPLLEQLNFIAITSSNLDEFFMVRVAGVYDQYLAGVEISENKTQMSPEDLLEAISQKNHGIVEEQYARYHELMKKLDPLNYQVKQMDELSPDEYAQAKTYFQNLIKPTLSPLGVDAYRPFPHIQNMSLNIFAHLSKDGESHTAIVPIPVLLDRYHIIERINHKTIILIEDIIIHFISELFQGYEVTFAYPFRITRNADFTIVEDDASDLLDLIEDYVKERRKGNAIRLELDTRYVGQYSEEIDDFIQRALELEDRDIYPIKGPLDLTHLFSLVDVIGEDYPEQLYPSFTPHLDPKHLGESLYDEMKQGDIFLNLPYDSFDPVVSLIQHAANDDKTIAIKQTLYRVSKNSPIIAALKQAAENGKEVTVLVELKARFDEENNVFWAKELEDAGCHVLYGVKELKTHSKISLIVRKEGDKIQRYVHLGTGNYNDKTAKTYTDMGIMTNDPTIGEDASSFFTFISGYYEEPDYTHLHVSPFAIRDSLSEYIEEEIAYHKEHGNGHIIAKMNSLTDKVLIQNLYRASQAGVRIDLIVRGICCLKPGVPGISENIHVRSIVGRFLEHSRIYYFNHNNQRHLFLSSADMMTRNMIKRIEIEFPILDQDIAKEIYDFLQLQLADTMKARELQSDGRYTRPDRTTVRINSQEEQMKQSNAKDIALAEREAAVHQRKPSFFERILARLRG